MGNPGLPYPGKLIAVGECKRLAISFTKARLEASPSPAHLRARMLSLGKGELRVRVLVGKHLGGGSEMLNWAGLVARWLCGTVLFQHVQESTSKLCHCDWERQGDNNRQRWPGFLTKDKLLTKVIT